MKTTKYIIKSYLSDGIVVSEVEVSKTKFIKAKRDTMFMYLSQEKDSEFYVDKDEREYNYNTYTARVTEFTYGISYIDYVVLECKKGYYFK